METPSTAASTVHPEELSPLSEERSPLDEQPPPFTVIYESTSDYLEKVSKLLSKKAKAVPHSDKRGIADALLDLGQILFQQDKYKKALKVFQRAERVQKLVIDETLQAVASSMAHLAQHHHQAGNGVLARLYETLAMELETSPSAAVLKQSLQHHAQHRAAQGPSPRLVHAVDRRLKRASAEAVPLVQTLKLQAHCQELARNDS
jgi:lipopolysaccharide biosynthesis regulator YciM